jgi:hypothetical protein
MSRGKKRTWSDLTPDQQSFIPDTGQKHYRSEETNPYGIGRTPSIIFVWDDVILATTYSYNVILDSFRSIAAFQKSHLDRYLFWKTLRARNATKLLR